jgi:hypothetical protein
MTTPIPARVPVAIDISTFPPFLATTPLVYSNELRLAYYDVVMGWGPLETTKPDSGVTAFHLLACHRSTLKKFVEILHTSLLCGIENRQVSHHLPPNLGPCQEVLRRQIRRHASIRKQSTKPRASVFSASEVAPANIRTTDC